MQRFVSDQGGTTRPLPARIGYGCAAARRFSRLRCAEDSEPPPREEGEEPFDVAFNDLPDFASEANRALHTKLKENERAQNKKDRAAEKRRRRRSGRRSSGGGVGGRPSDQM